MERSLLQTSAIGTIYNCILLCHSFDQTKQPLIENASHTHTQNSVLTTYSKVWCFGRSSTLGLLPRCWCLSFGTDVGVVFPLWDWYCIISSWNEWQSFYHLFFYIKKTTYTKLISALTQFNSTGDVHQLPLMYTIQRNYKGAVRRFLAKSRGQRRPHQGLEISPVSNPIQIS